jgi:hypothetical protein
MNTNQKSLNKKMLLVILFGMGFVVAAPVVQANIISQLDRISTTTEIDDWYFTVSGASTYLEVSARDEFGGIGNFSNPPGDYFDPEIALFVDNGALDAGDFIAFDKNGLGGGTSAHIWTTLTPGDYLLRVASADFTDTIGATNSTGKYTFKYMFQLSSSAVGGAVTLTAAPENVPEPATIFLIGIGLAGFLFRHMMLKSYGKEAIAL